MATLTSTVPRCRTCAGHLVSISLARADGELTMWSCSTCDLRWWKQGDELIDLGGVIRTMADERASTKKR